ncbi:MAG: hypothetical protein SV760_04235 [Halobacteria archaeon]|nr:hypothetical protein [Halobacteria archaeon]
MGFVVVATLATAGTWAIVEWLSDVYLGTRLIESEEELMVRFTAATAAGFLAGVVFTAYFQRERRMWLKRYRKGELSLASRTSEGDEG